MKVNYYVLNNRDVMYIKDDTKYSKQADVVNLFRVENIDGHLHVSLLPNYFEAEDGAEIISITPHSAHQIAAADSMSNFIVKQGEAGQEYGAYLIDESINCRKATLSEFSDYCSTLAYSNVYTPNGLDFMFDLYNNALDFINKIPSKVYPFDEKLYDPFNYQLLIQFDHLAENRKEAIKNDIYINDNTRRFF